MTQKYVSSKIVTAWAQPKDGEDGYAVKYADGYTSWSPAQIFEESHVAMGHTDALPAWQERIVAEYVQLNDRYTKLQAFLFAAPVGFDEVALDLLQEQAKIMSQYLDVLDIRLRLHGVDKLWTDPTTPEA